MLKGLLILVTLFSQYLCAHSDPLGYIYPRVANQYGEFQVYFEDNFEIKKGMVYKNIYDEKGVLLRSGKVLSKKGIPKITFLISEKVVLKTEKEIYRFNLTREEFSCVKSVDGVNTKIKIPLDPEKYDIKDVAVVAGEIAILYSGQDSKNLFLLLFDERHKILNLNLGSTSFIWSFPLASNMIVYNNQLFISMGTVLGENKYLSLVLYSFNVQTHEEKKTVLEKVMSWNTSISMGRIKNKLLVSWHGGDKERSREFLKEKGQHIVSFIKTRMIDLVSGVITDLK